MNQRETCPKCGAQDIIVRKKGFFDVVKCAFCGYDFKALPPKVRKVATVQAGIAQQNTATLFEVMKNYSVIGNKTIETALCLITTVVFLGDILFGLPRILVVSFCLTSAVLYALWLRYFIVHKDKKNTVVSGAILLLFLTASWVRWVDFVLY